MNYVAGICKACGEYSDNLRKKSGYKCKPCRTTAQREWQRANREKTRQSNREQYLKRIGRPLVRNMNKTPEEEVERCRRKSAKRCTRAKQARVQWDSELTDFVYEEALDLAKQREQTTGVKWQVDHIIPLRGKEVCGLHVWSNFAVITKQANLQKGNKLCVHL